MMEGAYLRSNVIEIKCLIKMSAVCAVSALCMQVYKTDYLISVFFYQLKVHNAMNPEFPDLDNRKAGMAICSEVAVSHSLL
jgi:hypothetical protein